MTKQLLALIAVLAGPLAAQAPDPWRADQASLAAKNDAERAKLWAAAVKDITTLEQREKQVLLETGIANDSDPQGLHYIFIQDQGRERRPRLEADAAGKARLDSVRKAGDRGQILQALKVRQIEAETRAVRADTTVLFWKEVERDVRRAETFYRNEDKPTNPPDVKAAIGRAITHFERFARLCREAIAFETKLSASLRREIADLTKQMAAAGAP